MVSSRCALGPQTERHGPASLPPRRPLRCPCPAHRPLLPAAPHPLPFCLGRDLSPLICRECFFFFFFEKRISGFLKSSQCKPGSQRNSGSSSHCLTDAQPGCARPSRSGPSSWTGCCSAWAKGTPFTDQPEQLAPSLATLTDATPSRALRSPLGPPVPRMPCDPGQGHFTGPGACGGTCVCPRGIDAETSSVAPLPGPSRRRGLPAVPSLSLSPSPCPLCQTDQRQTR